MMFKFFDEIIGLPNNRAGGPYYHDCIIQQSTRTTGTISQSNKNNAITLTSPGYSYWLHTALEKRIASFSLLVWRETDICKLISIKMQCFIQVSNDRIKYYLITDKHKDSCGIWQMTSAHAVICCLTEFYLITHIPYKGFTSVQRKIRKNSKINEN